MKKLVLDAGHGYNTPGKRSPDGVREWSLNNAVCNYIAEYLKGYDVQITRTGDTTGKTDVSLAERVKKTNSISPNAFVSIHHNAYNGKWNDATGIEVYYHTKGTATDRKLADILDNKIAKETGLRNRGVKTASFAVLGCKSSIPAVLCEGGFMDGRNDYKVITTEKGQRAYAKGVADGIIEFLGLTKKTTTTKPTTTKPTTATTYKAGNYKCLYNMKVRDGVWGKVKKVSQLTADGKKNATSKVSWAQAVYKKGTVFTAKKIINHNDGSVWAVSPSGYICIKDSKQIYCEKC